MYYLKTLSVFTFLIFSCQVKAQWTTDPAAPLIAGAAANFQSNVQSLADGNGGLFTFWRDSRLESGKFDIYGQHYNASGIAQWTENGKSIVDGNGTIQGFSIMLTSNGELLIAWIDYIGNFSLDNGIFAQKLDSDGDFLWTSNLLMKTGNSSISVRLVESAGQYYACMQALVIGGADKIYLNKLTGTGSLLWPLDEQNITYSTGDIGGVSATADDLGGIYIYYSTGNGSGASLLCNHLSGNLPNTNSWANWVNVTTGSSGLNYQFSGIGDSQGITLCWEGNATPNTTGNNLYSRRLMIDNGDLAWAGGTREICVANGNQGTFYWKKSDNDYYMVWADGRPGLIGNYGIYAHKFNKAGVVFWEENGVEVANLNTYIPNPEFDLDENNNMMVCHKAGTGFMAQKMNADGTQAWDSQGELVFTNTYAPFYGDFNMVYSGGNFLAISAKSNPGGGADGIYIAKIIVQMVEINETVTACNSYEYAGTTFTETGLYTIELPGDTLVTLNLTIYDAVATFSQDGNTLETESEGEYQWFNCDLGLPVDGATESAFTPDESGNYSLIINNGPCTDTSACANITLTGLEYAQDSFFQIYPNPGSESISISLNKSPHKPLNICFYDAQGRLARKHSISNQEYMCIDTSNLESGIYTIVVVSDDTIFHKKWIKQ